MCSSTQNYAKGDLLDSVIITRSLIVCKRRDFQGQHAISHKLDQDVSEKKGAEQGSGSPKSAGVLLLGTSLSARLKVYKFRSASTAEGTLSLSVVYDSHVRSLVPRKERLPGVPPFAGEGAAAGGAGRGLKIDTTNIPRNDSEDPLLPFAKSHPTAIPTPGPHRPTTYSSGGSPFPSPTTTKRVLSVVHQRGLGAALKNRPARAPLPDDPASPPSMNAYPEDPRSGTGKPPSGRRSGYSPSKPVFIPPIPQPPGSTSTSSPLPIPPPLRAPEIFVASDADAPEDDHPVPWYARGGRGWDDNGAADSGVGRRRESFGGGSSELFGSLVGSYEASILSGRMSSLPSKPITFLAEIGVVAFGKCKPSLKCPPHLTTRFPAYFYELQDDESPATPYVGKIDVENP
ncbi:hypothetical protein BDK51DRAFT_47102, partial [Blyttiomyces helicus]